MSEEEELKQLKYRLIELVKDEPMLWNQRDPIYKSKKSTAKNLKWANFAGQLGLEDAAAARNMWKSLRDQFSREAKKIPRFYSGMEAPEYELFTSWQFFNALLFLRNTVCVKKGTGNLQNYETETPSQQVDNHGNIADVEIIDLNGEDVDEPEERDKGNSYAVTGNYSILDTPRKSSAADSGVLSDVTNRRNSSAVDSGVFSDATNTNFGVRTKKSDKVFDLEVKKIELFKQKLEKEDRNEDAVMCFAKSLVPELKKAVRLSRLKRKINDLVDDFLEEEATMKMFRESDRDD